MRKVTITIEKVGDQACTEIEAKNTTGLDLIIACTALIDKIEECSGVNSLLIVEVIKEYLEEQKEKAKGERDHG